MDKLPDRAAPTQPTLFDLQESFANIELFPAVWSAAEAFIRSEPGSRQAALGQLIQLQAARFSPLVAYLLASRITDPELGLRAQIIQNLGEVLANDSNGSPAPENVRRVLLAHLSQMRQRQVYALLQVIVYNAALKKPVDRLLNICPYAGSHLADIMAGRVFPLEIREQAARAIGRVGYLDTLPVLERLVTRLETRLNGQKSMPFIGPATPDEVDLLPAVHEALLLLRVP